MTDGTVTPIRRGQHAYTDTAALNDIHALLTSTDLGADTLADVAAIVARTSRALVPVRDIETSSTETVLGWPVACVDAGDTCVFVRQATAGTGLVVEICTRTEAELAALAVTLDGRPLHPAIPGPDRLTHPTATKGTAMTIDHDNPEYEQPENSPADETVPGEPSGQAPPWRAMIPVSQLAAHPGNVRADLDLNDDFVASIAANGVLVALRVTPDGDGYRVIDGGRRLAAAIKAGVEEVPYDVVAERAGDEAGQYLDMILTNAHRNPLTVLEEADALFAAKKAGATRTRLRKTTGKNPAAVSAALAAARLTVETRDQAEQAGEQLTLDQYVILAEFQDDPDAVERLLTVARWGSMEHEAERIRQQRAEQAEHQRLRGELEEAGYQVADTAAQADRLLATLLQDGGDLTPEAHAACPGRAVFFRPWDLQSPVHYCTDPATYGHTSRYASPAGAPAPDGGDDSAPAAPPVEEPPDPSRRLVIEGNKAWAAATEVRHRWLTTLFTRRTAPRELAQFITRQLVTMPEPVRSGLGRAHHQMLFGQLTGRAETEWLTICETAPAGRPPVVMFAPVATAFESAMGEGEGRNTWRTDRYSPCPRDQAAAYLTLLAGLGYQLSAIEQAVATLTSYTGETRPGDLLTRESGPSAAGEQDPGGPEPGSEADDSADEADAAVSTDGEPGTDDLEDAA